MDFELRAYDMDDFRTRIYAAGAPGYWINPNGFRECMRLLSTMDMRHVNRDNNNADNDDDLPELI